MTRIHLADSDLMPEGDRLGNEFIDVRHHDRVIVDTATVRKPDGALLFTYVKDALPRLLCQQAFSLLKPLRFYSDNRGMAAGGRPFQIRKRNGTLSRTLRRRRVPSGVLGFLDPTSRVPYCRISTLTRQHFATFKAAHPFVVAVDRLYREWAPTHWEAQRDFVAGVPKEFVIPGTVFTTITINRSWRTAAHRDPNNFRPGLGIMCALEGGRFCGGELIFPKYRTAVDMRTGGLLLADVNELHGNGPLWGERFTRLSFVLYARRGMAACGTPGEECERAQRLG